MRRGLLRICAALCALALGSCALAEDVDLLAVDHRLYELGYRDGACSGVLDEVMVNALRNFQRANGLGITGAPDAGTVLVLNSEGAVSQADYIERVAQGNSAQAQLTAGTRGEEVQRLQRALQELGYFAGSCDGNFGSDTVEAVSRFQLANGLAATGVADGAVYARLYGGQPASWEDFLHKSAVAAGDAGVEVRMVQRWLRRKGYFEGECTGRYGESTQRAVRRFQTDAGLEVTGDADVETCRALFGSVIGLMEDAAAQRRGDSDARELCAGLTALGYAAHEQFDMQTELALMQFQRANGIPVTGVADAETLGRMGAADAVGCAGFVASGAEAAQAEDFGARVVQEAMRLLGEPSGFEEEFGLVQYVYLKCGVAVTNRAQFAAVGAADAGVRAGDVMVLEVDGAELCGVAASDGALIYRAGDGRVLMGYPRMMEAASVRLYRLAAQ